MTAKKAAGDLLKVPWTDHEDAYLQVAWSSEMTVESIATQLPKRSLRAITRRAHELGIKRPKNRPHPGKVVSPVFVRNGVPGKACVKCLEWKPLEKFARHKTCAGGRRNVCTTCDGKRAYANNPRARIAVVRAYQVRYPDRYRTHKAAANRRRHGAMVEGKVTAADVRLLLWLHGGKADTLDHVTPLSRGGKHEFGNLLPACKGCNFAKHTMTLEEWVACGMRGRRGM